MRRTLEGDPELTRRDIDPFIYPHDKEIEKVEDSMQQLRDEMERYKKGQGAMDSTRKKILDDLEGKVGRTDSKNRVYLEKNQRLMQSFDHLCSAVDIVFKQIGCDKMMAFQEHQEDKAAEVAQSMLWPSDANSEAASEAESAEPPRSPLTGGGSSMHKAHSVLELLGALGVNEMNIMQYLGIIEQRTNELIQSYKQKMALRDGKNVTQAGPSVAMGTTAYQISVPAVGDTTSADRQDIMYDAQGRVIEEGEGGPRPDLHFATALQSAHAVCGAMGPSPPQRPRDRAIAASPPSPPGSLGHIRKSAAPEETTEGVA